MTDGAGGLAVVDKPTGWTSHDVVAKLRGVLRERRVGHAGTLDPDATGVLLVGVGRVTRLLRFLTALPKTYTGEVVLGTETSTLDASGSITARHDMRGIGIEAVHAAAARLVGAIEQVPPMVSAVKVGGRRLHELAREGVEVDRDARSVVVHRFDVAATDDPLVWRIEVECSSGTYVRVLAADLGSALGGGAHLGTLRRVAIGSFREDEAVALDAVSWDVLLPPSAVVRDYPSVTAADDSVVAAIGHGKVLDADVLGLGGDGPWAVLDAAGRLLAVYESYGDGRVKPAVVIVT